MNLKKMQGNRRFLESWGKASVDLPRRAPPFSSPEPQAENGAARNGPFGVDFTMALIGLGQNGAALELEWSGAGSFKKWPDAVRFDPEIKIKKWAEPWVRPAPGCGLVNPHSVIPFFPIPASTAATLPLLRHRPSAGTLLLLHRSTITAPPPPCVASPWSTAQRRTPSDARPRRQSSRGVAAWSSTMPEASDVSADAPEGHEASGHSRMEAWRALSGGLTPGLPLPRPRSCGWSSRGRCHDDTGRGPWQGQLLLSTVGAEGAEVGSVGAAPDCKERRSVIGRCR
jgi:hypothetical protein